MALFTLALVLLNVLGNAFFIQLDLTEEKRFTLTRPTRELLRSVDDVVYVRVLLEGEFPAGFKRLQRATRELLQDFRGYSPWIEFEFEDPNEGTAEEVNRRRKELSELGINPTNLRLKDAEGTEEKLIYPWAIVYYKGREAYVNLLENQGMQNPHVVLNNSIALLEYKFANAISKLMKGSKPYIAFTVGHGELNELERKDLVNHLADYYNVGTFVLDSAGYIPDEVSVLIVARPRGPFSEKDKFKIDQYIMRGGKVIWLIDRLNAALDSLRGREAFVPFDYDLNLEDLLFKYGIRIEPNLLLDLQCGVIPQVVGMQGGQPQIDMFKWYYFPIVTPDLDHPVTKGLDGVYLEFPGTIDTTVRIKTPVKRTVLLHSSPYSRVQYSPVRLNFDILHYEPDPEKFSKGPYPVAMLLEGEFPSLYEHRVTEQMLVGLMEMGRPFKVRSVPTRMLVVSDGDIARNPVNPDGTILPLGYNRFMRYQFANRDFLLNAIEYLQDPDGVIAARAKDVKLRLLDTVRAQKERIKWQLLNLVAPILFLILFGIGWNWWRRRKYARA